MYLWISYHPASLAQFFFCDPCSIIGVTFKWNLFQDVFTNCPIVFLAKHHVNGLCVFGDVWKRTGKHRGTAREPPHAHSQVRALYQEHTAASRGICITTFLTCLIYNMKMYSPLLLEHHQHNFTKILVSGILFPELCLQGAAVFLELRLQILRQMVLNHTEALYVPLYTG